MIIWVKGGDREMELVREHHSFACLILFGKIKIFMQAPAIDVKTENILHALPITMVPFFPCQSGFDLPDTGHSTQQ
jgi:hypothetical protein